MADNPIPEAKAWMTKAWRDLETARRVASGQPPFYDIAVYHCQQSAEKAVKAFLIHCGKACEKTHDIEVLVDLACEADAKFSELADAADALTPYATRFRYPNATFAVEPRPVEYEEALQHAKTIYEFILDRLPKDARPEAE
ncbi:MAG: HEPN domain-containing protein [Verrucomicrobiota bacterium]|jgi:HEPN domain-containing protein